MVPLTSGDVVGVFELGAPSATEFVLHGTLPLPPGTYPVPGTDVPFAVLDSDGTPLSTQIEVVSAHADYASFGPEVVEIMARVKRPQGASTGDRIQYKVAVSPHGTANDPGTPGMEDLLSGPLGLPASVFSLLGNENNIVFSSSDVFGNYYYANALTDDNARLEKHGTVQAQLRTYNTMVTDNPVSGATGTLPHFMGVHSYISTFAGEEVVLMDVRFNNGASGLDGSTPLDDPLGKLYFGRIDVLVPNGWTVIQDVPDPFIGTPQVVSSYTAHPLVKPMSDGTLHVMGLQNQFHRRLAIAPIGMETRAQELLDQEGIAFCRPGVDPNTNAPLFSWWNPATARYFTQSHTLPSLDHMGLANVRATLAGEYAYHRNFLENGAKETAGGTKPSGIYPSKAGVLGWAHPFGASVGGMVGGDEIFLQEGIRTAASASNLGYRDLMMQHRMQNDRMPVGLFHEDGSLSRWTDWVSNVGTSFSYIPFIWFNGLVIGGQDPMGLGNAPDFQVNNVVASGKQPPYEAELLSFVAIDYQHYTRYTRSPMALAWLGNDSLSKDDIRMAAESFRMGYHEYPLFNGSPQVVGLMDDEQEVAADPGRGFSFGRGEGWGLNSMVAAYALTTDPAWRAEAQPWFERVIAVVYSGQSSVNGIVQSIATSKKFKSQYRFRQSIEQAIVENAFHGMKKTVWEGVDGQNVTDINQILINSWYGMISTLSWWPGENAPWAHVPLGPALGAANTQWSSHLDVIANLPLNCSAQECIDGHSDFHDNYQIGNSLALAYELTGDQDFLDKALLYTWNFQPGQTLVQKLEADGAKNIWNRAILLAQAQGL